MVIRFKSKFFLWCISFAVVLCLSIAVIKNIKEPPIEFLMGGSVYTVHLDAEIAREVSLNITQQDNEKYHRPSKVPALENPYNYQYIEQNSSMPEIPNPRDAILAYYGILEESSNMLGYSGGCGTIGYSVLPYQYSYSILSNSITQKMSLQSYIDSFKGIGHITLLQALPINPPLNAPPDTYYFAVETEVITGEKIQKSTYNPETNLSYFAYYYGIISVTKENGSWKISSIEHIPEQFLCAPYHSWFYDSKAVVEIIYKENLKIIDEITNTEKKDGFTYIYAKGNGKEYRFDFITLTNGYDILVNENVMKNGKWENEDLLTDDWAGFKLKVKQ